MFFFIENLRWQLLLILRRLTKIQPVTKISDPRYFIIALTWNQAKFCLTWMNSNNKFLSSGDSMACVNRANDDLFGRR